MKCQIAVIGPDIGNIKCLFELLLILYRRILCLEISDSTAAEYKWDLWCLFLHDLCEAHKELSNLLVGETLIVGEPVSGTLMVDTETHSSEWSEILCDLTEIFILQRTVDRKRQCHVLTMTADIAHLLKRFSLCIAVRTSAIREVIIIRIIPLKMDLHVLTCHTNTLRPFLILWIISIHNTNISMWSSQCI